LFTTLADQIAIVLLDLATWGMEADRTLERLRENSPDLPIVVMTGGREMDAMERFAGRSVTGVLAKPFSRAQLQRVIEEAARARSRESAAV
jgi:CheY-like chemotaxis protein